MAFLERRPEVRHDDGPEGIVQEIPGIFDQLAPHGPPRQFGMRSDPEVAAGNVGPDPVGTGRTLPVHPELEQRPGDVHHDPGVPGPDGLVHRNNLAQEGPLPDGLIHLERGQIRDCLGEGVAVGPVVESGWGLDRRHVHGVAGFVEQLVEVVEPAKSIGCEDPQFPVQPPPAEVGERDRVLPGPGRDVEVDVQRIGVGPQGSVVAMVDREQRVAGDAAGQPAGGGTVGMVVVPRLERPLGKNAGPGLEQRLEPTLHHPGLETENLHPVVDWALAGPRTEPQRHQGPIGRVRLVVSIDRRPDRIECAKEAFPTGGVVCRAEKREHRQAVEGVAIDDDTLRGRRIAGEDPALEVAERGIPHRDRRGPIVAIRRLGHRGQLRGSVGIRETGQRQAERTPSHDGVRPRLAQGPDQGLAAGSVFHLEAFQRHAVD